MSARKPRVSVVIPAYNEERRIRRCLDSLARQDYPADLLELIIVDDDSSDRTREVAGSYGAMVLRNGERNIERGKSIGARAATGDYVLLMDADNSLPGTDWLSKAVLALSQNPGAAGAQSARFDYVRDDPPANRYCALFGINDPFAFYLGKRDKLTWYENDWSISGEVLDRAEDYFLVRFTQSNLPTVGSQGYLVSREVLESTGYGDHLFHMEMNLELVRSGRDEFVMLRDAVSHDHCSDTRVFMRKLKRNFLLFLEQREMRTYRWETSRARQALALVEMLTFLVPLAHALRGFLKIRDVAWFLHPFMCAAVTFMYAYLFARWHLSRVLRRSV